MKKGFPYSLLLAATVALLCQCAPETAEPETCPVSNQHSTETHSNQPNQTFIRDVRYEWGTEGRLTAIWQNSNQIEERFLWSYPGLVTSTLVERGSLLARGTYFLKNNGQAYQWIYENLDEGTTEVQLFDYDSLGHCTRTIYVRGTQIDTSFHHWQDGNLVETTNFQAKKYTYYPDLLNKGEHQLLKILGKPSKNHLESVVFGDNIVTYQYYLWPDGRVGSEIKTTRTPASVVVTSTYWEYLCPNQSH